jgi:short-subunit dehydrogenase involved in D-alanine esterification of teichoic acids
VAETVAVVGAGELDMALRWAARGAAVIVAGTDAGAVGALVARLRESGARAAAMVADMADAEGRRALAEMAGELFPGHELLMEL